MEFLSNLTSGLLELIGKSPAETAEQIQHRELTFLIQNLKLTEIECDDLARDIGVLCAKFEYPLNDGIKLLLWLQKDLKAPPIFWSTNLRYALKLARTYGRSSCLTLTKEDVVPGLKWKQANS